MTADDDARLAEEHAGDLLAAKLAQIAAAANNRPAGFQVPELDADPDVDDPTNVWMLADGRLRSRTLDGVLHQYGLTSTAIPTPAVPVFATDPVASTGWKLWINGSTLQLRARLANGSVVQYAPITGGTSSAGGDAPTSAPSGTSSVPKPADPTPVRYYKVYLPTWAVTICSAHGVETGTALDYGYAGAVHGERKIMFGFDDATIRADLAGSTVRQVQLKVLNVASWSRLGVDITWGAHNRSGTQTAYSSVREAIYVGSWPASGWGGDADRWRDLSLWLGTALRDNTAKGLTIDQPFTKSASGELDATTLALAITYTR